MEDDEVAVIVVAESEEVCDEALESPQPEMGGSSAHR